MSNIGRIASHRGQTWPPATPSGHPIATAPSRLRAPYTPMNSRRAPSYRQDLFHMTVLGADDHIQSSPVEFPATFGHPSHQTLRPTRRLAITSSPDWLLCDTICRVGLIQSLCAALHLGSAARSPRAVAPPYADVRLKESR